MDTTNPDKASQPGAIIRRSFRGLGSTISDLAWSPDGTLLAVSTDSGAVAVWGLEEKESIAKFNVGKSSVLSIAWSHDGKVLASGGLDHVVRLWAPNSGEMLKRFSLHEGPIRSLAWSPTENLLASGSDDFSIRIWDAQSDTCLKILRGHQSWIRSLAWSHDGKILASSSDDHTVKLWRPKSGTLIRTLAAHSLWVLSVCWSPDSKTLASGSGDRTLRIWDPERGNLTDILEGHTLGVTTVDFSPDGKLLASRSLDSTVRIWRSDTWETLAILPETTQPFPRKGLAFHPKLPVLAAVGEDSSALDVWALNLDELEKSALATRAIHYANAKVVLVGDTGVGKSGLGLVLTGHDFVPTESTHGRHVWTFESDDVQLPDNRLETREVLLWDLAGQPGYRLIHQLYLTEVAVALVIFDARSETDPFSGVLHWCRALNQALNLEDGIGPPMKKFLVAARGDRGGISVSKEQLGVLVDRLGFDGYYQTSAKEGWGVEELRDAIRRNIDWSRLPRVTSTALFQKIKLFLIGEKREGRLLSTQDDLYMGYLKASNTQSTHGDQKAEFHTCIGRVESRGLIRRLSFGNLVLLQPELLDAYAAGIVNAAKIEPYGTGSIAEEAVLAGEFPMSNDERIMQRDQERLLLIATVEELLRHEIALREQTEVGQILVLPSQFTRDWPDSPDPEGKAIVFRFEGPVLNIYTTLAIRLSRSGLFKRREMWRNAAIFDSLTGEGCGLWLRNLDEGRAELTLFFDSKASESTRLNFEKYASAHLERRAVRGSISSERIIVCRVCDTPLASLQVERRRARGHDSIQCGVCESTVSLKKTRTSLSRTQGSAIRRMDQSADAERERDVTMSILQGKIETGDYDVFMCHNSSDKRQVKRIGEKLKSRGILPWLDVWELQPGIPWQKVLEAQIGIIKSAAVFVGDSGIGPWEEQEMHAFLREFISRGCPVIPVLLPSAPIDAKLPVFLKGMTWVNFTKRVPDPVDQLVWGITGVRAHH